MNSTGFGSTLGTDDTEQSLIGPPAAADAQGQVGLAQPTPEELEKIQEELLKKKELGLYSEKDLLEEGGKKILVDKGNAQVGVDHETGAPVVRHASGTWLSPADGEYEKTLNEASAQAKGAGRQEAGGEPQEPGKKSEPDQKAKEHEEMVQQVKTMVAIDKGELNPEKKHDHLDEVALQRIRAGASTMEVKNLKNLVAAVDGFASIEATDINPEMERLKPTNVSGPGVDLAMDGVRKRKERENAQVAEMDRLRREKEKKA